MSGNNEGDWEWNNSRMSGYSYPVDAHMITPNSEPVYAKPWPTRQRRRRMSLGGFKAAVIAAIVFTAFSVTLAMLTAPQGQPGPTALPLTVTTQVASASAYGGWPGLFTAPRKMNSDPYSDPGDWLVGVDLPPGTYRVLVTGELGGYWARCADDICAVGIGMLANALLPRDAAESVLDIAATDHKVKTAGIRLVPA